MTSKKDVRREIVLRSIDRYEEDSASLFKWCLTSLLVLNGGALLAVVNNEGVRQAAFQSVAWKFALGVGLSVVTCFFVAYSMAAISRTYAEYVWENPELSEVTLKGILHSDERGGGSAFLGFTLGILSALLFVWGCYDLAQIMGLGTVT